MLGILRRTTWAVVMAVAVASLGLSVRAADAEGRGLLDSVVDTLVGGNYGDGATDAKQVPLRFTLTSGGGLARDSSGAIYVTENGRILKISGGAVSVIAGASGITGFRGDGDLATRAIFDGPMHLAIDGSDNIYVLDVGNGRVRKITKADGKISTIAGNGQTVDAIADVNRLAVDARINASNLSGIAVNAAGDLFLADDSNCMIYKVAAADKMLTIFGGNGTWANAPDDVVAVGNPLTNSYIGGIAVNSSGDVLYTCWNAVRKIKAADGKNKIIAGAISTATPPTLYTGLGILTPDTGTPALAASAAAPANGPVDTPARIAIDGATIIVWDAGMNNFRSITEGGNALTVFGPQDTYNGTGFRGDGAAAATNTVATTDDDPRADPGWAYGVAASGGVVSFVDYNNNRVRQFTVGGNAAAVAGCWSPFRNWNIGANQWVYSDDAAVGAKGAYIHTPRRITKGAAGVVYFSANDEPGNTKIYKYDDAAKTVSVVAGPVIVNGFTKTPGDGGPATGANLIGLGAQIAVDGTTTYFADTLPDDTSRHVVRKIDAAGVITTVAGIADNQGNLDPDGDPTLTTATTPRVNKDATKVLIDTPEGVAVTATDLLIAEFGTSSVLKVNKATGILTVANTGALGIQPSFLAVGRADGSILAASRNSANIQRIDGAGAVTTFETLAANCRGLAVSGTTLYAANNTGDIEVYNLDGADLALPLAYSPLTSVNVSLPGGIVASGTTITYVNGNRLQQVTDSGIAAPVVSTIAGTYFSVVGTGGVNVQIGFDMQTAAPLALSGTDVLVADQSDLLLRKVTPTTPAAANVPPVATAVTVAGTGNDSGNLTGEGGPATTALIGSVGGIAVAADGTVMFSDSSVGIIRRVSTAGIIDTYVGIPGRAGYSGDGLDRLATILNYPTGVAYNGTGELHFAEENNHTIRKVQADGKVVLVAGTPTQSGYAGNGYPAAMAMFYYPMGIVFDKNGDLVIADYYNYAVRVITASGIVDTIAGTGGWDDSTAVAQNEMPALDAYIGYPTSVAVDTGGKVYNVSGSSADFDLVLRTASGYCRAVVGVGNAEGFNGDGLPGLRTMIYNPEGVAYEDTLGLVFTDTGNNRVRRVTNLAEKTNSPPEAVIVATPDKLGQAPLKVRFDGTNSVDADGDIIDYVWTFGDSTTGNGPVVEHVYAALGSYTVTLTVTDTQGNTSTATTAVFAALPLIHSGTNGKGAFKVAFGPKAGTKDSFALSMKNVPNLTSQAGKAAKIYIGSFTIDATVGGKGVKVTSKTVKLAIDPSEKKRTVTLAIKGVKLSDALIELGVKNENTVAPGKTVLIPVVVVVDNGALVVGDKFLFVYKGKYNSGASGKFSQ